MDLSFIRTFLHVAAVGSFTKAAEDLQYAQSTVTSQIKALEKELGFPLFERIGRKCYLTDAGREFLSSANEIQHILNKATGSKKVSSDAPVFLRIGVVESLLFRTMLNILPLFRSAYPNAELQLQVGTVEDLTDMLKHNHLDMVYICSSHNTDNTLSCRYQRQERMVFVADAAHPLACKKTIRLQELFCYPFISIETSSDCCRVLREMAADAGIEVHPVITINDIDAIMLLLQDKTSFSFLPECGVFRHLEKGSLTVLDTGIQPPVYYSQILLRKSQWISPQMQHLICLVQQHLPQV